jgi:hypothetical protein
MTVLILLVGPLLQRFHLGLVAYGLLLMVVITVFVKKLFWCNIKLKKATCKYREYVFFKIMSWIEYTWKNKS